MASNGDLPKTMKALVLKSRSEPLTVESVPTPQATIGSAVVRVLSASVISYMRDIYNGVRPYPYPTPIVPGTSAVGRVVTVGPDATKLRPGDLVLVDCFIQSRDDPTDRFLAAIHEGFTKGSAQLMTIFKDWTYAEYCRSPLENLFRLDEKHLLGSPHDGGLGFNIHQLALTNTLAVPYGGLRDIELKAGQTVIVAPATGPFGGAAVLVAQAMGARVIAMGRNKDSLKFLKDRVPYPERLETVPITGDMQADCSELRKHGEIDAYYDIGPPEAYNSTHIKSAILALKHGARISLMGGYREDVAIPHMSIMHKNIRLYGKWMYERSDIADLVKLIEAGMLDIGLCEVVGTYPLGEWSEAFDKAAGKAGFGQVVVIKP